MDYQPMNQIFPRFLELFQLQSRKEETKVLRKRSDKSKNENEQVFPLLAFGLCSLKVSANGVELSSFVDKLICSRTSGCHSLISSFTP